MIINQRIRDRRIQLGLTQDEVAKYVGYKGRSSIHKLETTKLKIDPKKIELFARALQTSPAYLMGWIDSPDLSSNEVLAMETEHSNNINMISVPILADVSAGYGSYADVQNNAVGYEQVPVNWVPDKQGYVFLKVKGDSMLPRFEEDDLVLVKCQASVDSGSYAIAIIDNEAGVVKKVVYGDDWIELQSLNPKYPVRRFEGAEVSRIRIFGLVKKAIRNYN